MQQERKKACRVCAQIKGNELFSFFQLAQILLVYASACGIHQGQGKCGGFWQIHFKRLNAGSWIGENRDIPLIGLFQKSIDAGGSFVFVFVVADGVEVPGIHRAIGQVEVQCLGRKVEFAHISQSIGALCAICIVEENRILPGCIARKDGNEQQKT